VYNTEFVESMKYFVHPQSCVDTQLYLTSGTVRTPKMKNGLAHHSALIVTITLY